MSSSYSHSGTHLDRKALKRPDEFFAMLQRFFDGLGKHVKGTLVFVVVVLLVGALIATVMTRRESRAEAGRNALFLAQKSVETGLKFLAAEYAPPAAAEAPATGKDKTKKEAAKTPPAPRTDAILYKKIDVDAKLGTALTQLKAVADQYGDTRPGFEAALSLGNIYFNHGNAAQAQLWFQKALSRAAGPFEKSVTGLALGQSLEDQGKSQDAIQAFETALGAGNASMKGELLMAIARNYELLHDGAKARSTYDKIISQIPGTEYSRAAETAKALLE